MFILFCCNATNVIILLPVKIEPVETTTILQKTLSPVKAPPQNPLVQGIKRSLSPDADSNSSIESKWKDIKDILEPNNNTNTQQLMSPKKIKTEPGGCILQLK